MKRFSLRLEKDLHEKLRLESFETGRSINEIIVELIRNKYKEEANMKFNRYEIVYKDEEGEVIVAEYSGNRSHTVDQALEIAGVDMDEFAEENDWGGWDWNCLEIRVKKENENMKKFEVEITRNGKAWTEEIQAENGDSACYKALEPYAQKMGGKVVHGIQGIGVESPVIGSWPTQYTISYWATCLA